MDAGGGPAEASRLSIVREALPRFAAAVPRDSLSAACRRRPMTQTRSTDWPRCRLARGLARQAINDAPSHAVVAKLSRRIPTNRMQSWRCAAILGVASALFRFHLGMTTDGTMAGTPWQTTPADPGRLSAYDHPGRLSAYDCPGRLSAYDGPGYGTHDGRQSAYGGTCA